MTTGSYIRLVLAGGTRENGPFFPNPSSKATTTTLLAPGTDGGLRTGAFQPAPTRVAVRIHPRRVPGRVAPVDPGLP